MQSFLFACLFVFVLNIEADGTTPAEEELSTTVGPTEGCHDDPNANCGNMTAYCNSPAYRDLLERECPVTCNFCSSLPPCQDVSDKCALWKTNGICSNPFYTNEVDKYCRKTCGLC